MPHCFYGSVKRLLVVVVFLGTGAFTVQAAEFEQWNDPYDALFRSSGASATYRSAADHEFRELRTKNGVIVRQTREDGVVQTTTIDNSELGAVWCAWKVFAEVDARISICTDRDEIDGADRIGRAYQDISAFIIENSLEQLTHQDLAMKRQELDRKIRSSLEYAPSTGTVICLQGDPVFFNSVDQMVMLHQFLSNPEIPDLVAEILSVPRIPAEHPCL